MFDVGSLLSQIVMTDLAIVERVDFLGAIIIYNK